MWNKFIKALLLTDPVEKICNKAASYKFTIEIFLTDFVEQIPVFTILELLLTYPIEQLLLIDSIEFLLQILTYIELLTYNSADS